MKPLRTFELSGFAMVNENGYRGVGDKSGAVAGVSGIVVHTRHARVCGRSRNSSRLTQYETAHLGAGGAHLGLAWAAWASGRFSAVSDRTVLIFGSVCSQ